MKFPAAVIASVAAGATALRVGMYNEWQNQYQTRLSQGSPGIDEYGYEGDDPYGVYGYEYGYGGDEPIFVDDTMLGMDPISGIDADDPYYGLLSLRQYQQSLEDGNEAGDEEGDDDNDFGLYDTDDDYYYDYPAQNAMGVSSYVAIKPTESDVEDTIERGAQLPPRSTPSDLRWIADATYYHDSCNRTAPYRERRFVPVANCTTGFKDANEFLTGPNAITGTYSNGTLSGNYTAIKSYLFQGDTPDRDRPTLTEQFWNVLLVEQTLDNNQKEYIIAFEGTEPSYLGSWLADVVSLGQLDTKLFNAMNSAIQKWLDELTAIDGTKPTVQAIIGHSAGCMFVKNVFTDEDLAAMGNPYLICFNGYDPRLGARHRRHRREIHLRTAGDSVSGCVGSDRFNSTNTISRGDFEITDFEPNRLVTVCSLNPTSIIKTHKPSSYELTGVTWKAIDTASGNFYNFAHDGNAFSDESAGLTACNRKRLRDQQRGDMQYNRWATRCAGILGDALYQSPISISSESITDAFVAGFLLVHLVTCLNSNQTIGC